MAKADTIHYVQPMATYTVTGMTCGGCAAKVERTLKAVAGDVTVTLDPPRAMVGSGAAMATLNEALAAVGKYRLSLDKNGISELPAKSLQTYYPLIVVIGLTALAALAASNWMLGFMAGFFIVFGAFKLLDVPAFAQSYARYDLVAKAFKPWGYVYPFVELGLGFAFLFHVQLALATWLALIASLVGAAGVIQSVMRKETIQCACLGTVFNLPMSTVTIVENLGMAAMAAYMLTSGVSLIF